MEEISKKDVCVEALSSLTGKKNILFTRRGNNSIELVLGLVKGLGKEIVLIQDQGGWMTYEELAEKQDLKVIILKTNLGLIESSQLSNYHDAVLLINSMPAYSFIEDMISVEVECEQNKIMIINDVSGSIGKEPAKIGDVIIGSFGRWKPINIGEGGFIATDNDNYHSILSAKTQFNPTEEFFINLEKKLSGLGSRLKFLEQKRSETIQKLQGEGFEVLMPESEGLNVIVWTPNKEEKDKVKAFCEKNKLEYTDCPRDIRVDEEAISIEIKRMDLDE
ncbi:hypothetical protein GOV05_03665 [Candidatus Woesearchaeota archaeon]|nr:hypothetical protein [Candidatus Woesearchaeota archaeon]